MERVSYTVEVNMGILFEAESKEELPLPDAVKEAFQYQLNDCIENQTDWNATINKVSVI
ncbi:hypothetical protein ACFLTP_10875 [Chloroflexota bacterium]